MKYSNLIGEEIKQAMREKQKIKLEALRAVKTAFTLAVTSKGAGQALSDDEEMKIMQKLVKQRKDSAEIYSSQQRPELAEKELEEARIIEGFLPEAMSEEEIRAEVSRIISETGASSMADMGKVMGIATQRLAGRAEGRVISGIVRSQLST